MGSKKCLGSKNFGVNIFLGGPDAVHMRSDVGLMLNVAGCCLRSATSTFPGRVGGGRSNQSIGIEIGLPRTSLGNIVTTPTTASTQPNLTSTEVGFDTKMTLHTTHHLTPPPTQTQIPSQSASDQPLMLIKRQHQH